MEWQDAVFGIGSVIFMIALIPSVIKRQAPALSTSVTTALVLFVFSATYASLDYEFATVTNLITAILWLWLAVQRAEQSENC